MSTTKEKNHIPQKEGITSLEAHNVWLLHLHIKKIIIFCTCKFNIKIRIPFLSRVIILVINLNNTIDLVRYRSVSIM